MYKNRLNALSARRSELERFSFTFCIDIIVLVGTYFFVSFFIFPRKFDLSIPTHSDYYVYYVYSQNGWTIKDLLLPRPLFWAYLQILGIFHEPRNYYLGLALPAFIFIYLFFRFLNQIVDFTNRYAIQVLFYSFVFTSSYFFQVFQLDVGGTLAGIFTVISLSSLYKYQRNVLESSRYLYFSFAFFILALETKPNFTVLSVSIYLFLSFKLRSIRSIYFAAFSVLISISVFLTDKIRGSVWVQSSNSESPYAVAIDPIKNSKLIFFYIAKSMNWPLIFLTILSTLILVFYRSWRVVAIFALTIPASLATLSLLVNRPWEMYAWYPRIFFAAFNIIAFEIVIQKIKKANLKTNKLYNIFIFLTAILLTIADNNFGTTQNYWYRYIYSYNSNILRSLEKVHHGKDALLAGVNGPYHPFKNTEFINLNYPNLRGLKVLLKESEKPWNDMSPQLLNGIYFKDIIFSDFSVIYITNKTGNLVAVIDPKIIKNIQVSLQEEILQCIDDFNLTSKGQIVKIKSSNSNCSY